TVGRTVPCAMPGGEPTVCPPSEATVMGAAVEGVAGVTIRRRPPVIAVAGARAAVISPGGSAISRAVGAAVATVAVVSGATITCEAISRVGPAVAVTPGIPVIAEAAGKTAAGALLCESRCGGRHGKSNAGNRHCRVSSTAPHDHHLLRNHSALAECVVNV